MPIAKTRRLLLFAYLYPPLGGPAVQRPCKTVKYLTQLGWQVDVITIKDIVYHSRDETLLAECNAHKIIRTASLDPMYLLNKLRNFLGLDTDKIYFQTQSAHKTAVKKLFPVDDKIGWLPFAVRAGKQALLTNRYDAVMVTCGPFSSALAARHIAKAGKIPFVMDYRDLWTLNNTTYQPRGIFFKLLQNLEKKCLQTADLVLTATDFMKQALLTRYGQDLETKILPFFNGWDEADFEGKKRLRQADGKIRIAYLGTLYADRSLIHFLQALQQISITYPELDFEFRLIGNFYPETYLEVEESGVADRVNFIGQMSHSEAIQNMLDADVLLLVIGGKKNNWIVTGKLFEYLRSRRPILALASEGNEAALILRSCGHDAICEIDNTEAIIVKLEQLFSTVKTSDGLYTIPVEYERSKQVKNLAERLECL